MLPKIEVYKKEYYQVVTKDRKHVFENEHQTSSRAFEHLETLRNAEEPYRSYEYEIVHIVDTRTEEVVTIFNTGFSNAPYGFPHGYFDAAP